MDSVPAQLATLPGYIASLAALGQRTAIVEHGLYRSHEITYSELIAKARAFAASLPSHGVQPGGKVLIWGPAGIAWAVAFYGCVLAGVVAVPLDAAFSPAYVERIREQTGAVLLCAGGTVTSAIPVLSFARLASLPGTDAQPSVAMPARDALLEIVYTSGATADPKGVMITHGNLLANLRPIAGEIAKYKSKARWVLPLRFLHLIPLSHLFGQVMGLFIPPLLDSAVVYPESQAPAQWAVAIHRYRASVMVAVPQQLRLFTEWAAAAAAANLPQVVAAAQSAPPATGVRRWTGILTRWWRWRRLHRRLGWRMWAFIVGGAALPPELESFWNATGYAVVQGYGLTETAPAIAITHPFKARRGAVGRLLAGVETRIAPDGEILVRGGNVSPGYYQNAAATAAAFDDGWLRTGDLGRLDDDGNLIYLGRKKEVIVTPDGLNVYPADIENVLDQMPQVAESAVVESNRQGSPQVHAVLVLRPAASPAALDGLVAAANTRLELHQRIRSASLWPESHLPRTASTGKLRRGAIAAWVNQGGGAVAHGAGGEPGDWKAFAAQRWGIAPQRFTPAARLDADLGLSSLDRVELWTWLEAHAAAGEESLTAAQTVADVDRLLDSAAPARARSASAPALAPAPTFLLPTAWPTRPSIRRTRTLLRSGLVFPALRTVVRQVAVTGLEHLNATPSPVLFIANHQSMLDVPVILRALPRAWRPWLAVAAGADLIGNLADPRLNWLTRERAQWRYQLVRGFFNAYPLSERGAVAAALRFTGSLMDSGYCPLIFPEGARTRDGRLQPFRPGIGAFVAELRVPVVPIRISGLWEILPVGARRARSGRARVEFGPSLRFDGQSAAAITRDLEAWYSRVSA